MKKELEKEREDIIKFLNGECGFQFTDYQKKMMMRPFLIFCTMDPIMRIMLLEGPDYMKRIIIQAHSQWLDQHFDEVYNYYMDKINNKQ